MQASVDWNPRWSRFHPVQYVLTGALIAADIAIVQLVPDPQPRWKGGLLFDNAATTILRADTGEARERAQVWSNRFHEGTFLFGVLEGPFAAGVVHGNWDVAFQISLINAQSFAVAGFVQLLSARLVGRVRPFSERCAATDVDFPCKEGGVTLSFLSGHAMTSFVSAGLVCAHHSRLPLWGHRVADASACALTLASGTVTGVLRVVADKHYATDVLLGMILGFTFGYGMPMLLHYRNGDAPAPKATTSSGPKLLAPLPLVTDRQIGLMLAGML